VASNSSINSFLIAIRFSYALAFRKTAFTQSVLHPHGFSLAYSLATGIFGGFTPLIATYVIELTKNRAFPRYHPLNSSSHRPRRRAHHEDFAQDGGLIRRRLYKDPGIIPVSLRPQITQVRKRDRDVGARTESTHCRSRIFPAQGCPAPNRSG
jgi:hypothetical protein